jgi:hypothetical protein
MGPKSSALGVVAAAALSTAGLAAPCVGGAISGYSRPGILCAVNGETPGGSGALVLTADSETAASEILNAEEAPIDDPASVIDEPLSDAGIKITNLQATMTANKYVADIGTFAPAALSSPTDDVAVYGLDYRAIKNLPRLPKRRPSAIGVGLTTPPSSTAKKPGTTRGSGIPSELDRK